MDERIRELRKALGLNQTEFGGKIGVKQGTIAGYESGNRIPLDTVISSICRVYNVSEIWLRTGEGDMFRPMSRDDELAAFFGGLLQSEPSFKRRLITVLARLSEDEWKLLEQKALELTEDIKRADP